MCTNISIPSKSKGSPLISARTMDWLVANPSRVSFVPRGQSFPANPQPGEIRWKNKYGFVGSGFINDGRPLSYSDGLNEAGLSAASLWLSCTEYPKTAAGKPFLYNQNLVTYVLSNFKTITEVKAALARLAVLNIQQIYPAAYSLLHYIISDINGDHLIVEFVKGKMITYTNRLGVLTNQPTYDWHLTNIGFYAKLSLKNDPHKVCGEEVTGSGQLGIPGDPSPQSRFVRAAFLRQAAFLPQNTQQSIGVARQILQTLSVPVGTVLAANPAAPPGIYDWTQWSVIRDHTNRSYYFYSDFNSKLYGIHLRKLNMNAKKQKQINIYQPKWYRDITKVFES